MDKRHGIYAITSYPGKRWVVYAFGFQGWQPKVCNTFTEAECWAFDYGISAP